MGVLFGYELKKLLSRKLIWPLLAVCVAMNAWVFWSFFTVKSSGMVDGMREAYRVYDGLIVNDALVRKVKADLNEYISTHPDDFVTDPSGLDEDVPYYPSELGYTYGYWSACLDITHQQTEEEKRKQNEQFKKYLDTGQDDDGNAFTRRDRRFFEHALSASQEPTVVHYAEGWRQMLMQVQWQGVYVLILFVPALVPLFTCESSAKLEGVLLSSARRKRAVAAKLLVTALYAAVMALVVYGLPLLLTGLTYGLDGASQPASTLNGWLSHLPGETVGFVYLKAGLVSLLAAVASGLAVALGSSLFRHPLSALLGCAALLLAPFVPFVLMQTGMLVNLWSEWDLPARVASLLPPIPLAFTSSLLYSLNWVGSFETALALSVLVGCLASWLTPRLYLKPGKA